MAFLPADVDHNAVSAPPFQTGPIAGFIMTARCSACPGPATIGIAGPWAARANDQSDVTEA
ncbi:hypothetical protein CK228_11935 [Mesorhizobium sp. WSM4312]|nr:hypothetical protein CK232_11215 [Mesorhizobium sp. WSM4304]PBB68513.1 hypothetical protein CK228_11935 [Mesorhizobium sp. WSM4312]PBB76189.1 hypothetical protein CK227_06920 [Mesorhizobium sp. WSM4308]